MRDDERRAARTALAIGSLNGWKLYVASVVVACLCPTSARIVQRDPNHVPDQHPLSWRHRGPRLK